MRATEAEHLIKAIADDARALAGGVGRPHPIRAGHVLNAPRLAWVLADVAQWAGHGYPAGSDGVRGSSDTSVPERIAVAGIPDTHAADLLEAEATLRSVADGLRWLVAFQARNTPSRRNPDDRPTATCGNPLSANELLRGCGRVIAGGRQDPIRRGLCDECYWPYRDSFRKPIEAGEPYHA